MDFNFTERQSCWRDRVRQFMDAHVRPAVAAYEAQQAEPPR